MQCAPKAQITCKHCNPSVQPTQSTRQHLNDSTQAHTNLQVQQTCPLHNKLLHQAQHAPAMTTCTHVLPAAAKFNRCTYSFEATCTVLLQAHKCAQCASNLIISFNWSSSSAAPTHPLQVHHRAAYTINGYGGAIQHSYHKPGPLLHIHTVINVLYNYCNAELFSTVMATVQPDLHCLVKKRKWQEPMLQPKGQLTKVQVR